MDTKYQETAGTKTHKDRRSQWETNVGRKAEESHTNLTAKTGGDSGFLANGDLRAPSVTTCNH
jgi:hypothetical protein